MIGTSLLHYRITARLGVGGMGEVYRATDTKLDREVAIKVLPPAMTSDPERVARFQREARTLASLNHPNIAGLYGFEIAEGQRFLVMELVEGETLAERITRGKIPLEEALEISRQIADGLEEAHEKGIVHRDLKPANVKLTPEDKVKVLDFGLARAYQGDGVGETSMENSPTITAAMTQQGVILGTAAYMSPEQAKGKTVDRRADLWSFGVLLWEMLTGERLFAGETTSDTLAAVLRAEPDYDLLPEETPPAVRRMLERCLERDPRKRLRDIGEARVRLERWRDDPSTMSGAMSMVEDVPGERSPVRWLPWVLVLAGAIAAIWGWMPRGSAPVTDPQQIRVEIKFDEQDRLATDVATNVVISPDGSMLAYIAGDRIMVRDLNGLQSRELAGTEGAQAAVFSPDSQWLAYWSRGTIWRTSATGGAPFKVCDVGDPRGLAWANPNTLVYSPAITGGLWTASVSDGSTRELTQLDPDRNERSHRWPSAMPDGKSVIFIDQFFARDYDQSDIQIVSLETGKRRTVYRGGAAPRYVSSGHLLFVRKNTLFAIPMDPETGETRGSVAPVLEDLWASVGDQEACDGSAQYDVSRDGTLVYRSGTNQSALMTRITRVDFATGDSRTFGDAADHETPLVSPDGSLLAYGIANGQEHVLYLMETDTGLSRQFSFGEGASALGCWSPDSKYLYWSESTPDGGFLILRRPADGSLPAEEIYQAESTAFPTSVSPDGKQLLLTMWSDSDLWDVYSVDLEAPDAKAVNLIGGALMQFFALYSPDGRWLSYMEGGSAESILYVAPNPPTGARWELGRGDDLVEGGQWSGDGSSLYFRDAVGILRFPVSVQGSGLRVGRGERLLTENAARSQGYWASSVTPEGDAAWLFKIPGGVTEDHEVHTILVTDWLRELKSVTP